MTSTTLKNCSIAVFFLTLAVCAIVATRDFHSITGEAHGPLTSLNAAAGDVADYVRVEKQRLENPKNEKALDAAIQMGAVFNGTGRLVNTQVVPRLIGNFDQSEKLLAGLTDASKNFSTVLLETSTSVNKTLVPKLADVLDSIEDTGEKLGMSVADINDAVKTASDKTGRSLDAVYGILSDPQWKEALGHVNGAAAGIETTTQNIGEASKQAPSIAQSLEKIAKTSSKFAKATLLANILSTLARGFVP